MLTYIGKFIKWKHGYKIKPDDLDLIYRNLVRPDVVNFGGNISKGYPQKVAKLVIDAITLPNPADIKVLVNNDISTQMYFALRELGVKHENIYLSFGKWTKQLEYDDTWPTYDFMKLQLEVLFKEFKKYSANVITIKEIFMNKINFDLIISNPPYGALGANITKKIIDEVEFKEFVNLLPANDYERNSTKDLFKYVRDMTPVNDGFDDAAVTTSLCKLAKEANAVTLDDFELSQYIDPSLDKYFKENRTRTHYALDSMPKGGLTLKHAGIWDVTKTFIIGYRDMNHKHLPFTKNCTSYKWNVEESVNMQYLIDKHNTRDDRFMISQCVFDTAVEKANFINFTYSDIGFKFTSKLFTAINCDSTTKKHVFPKVDWTRSWTVEEILADYNYTPEEIKEVINDLANFRGMNESDSTSELEID